MIDKLWIPADAFEDHNTGDQPMTTQGCPIYQDQYFESFPYKNFQQGQAYGTAWKYFVPVGTTTLRYRFWARYSPSAPGGGNMVLWLNFRQGDFNWRNIRTVYTVVDTSTTSAFYSIVIDVAVSVYGVTPGNFWQFSFVRKGDDTADTCTADFHVAGLNLEAW